MLASRRLWLGTAVTAAFLGLLAVRVDFSAAASAFAEANYAYLLPAVAVYFVSLYFRAFRWRFLLSPFDSIHTWRLYPVVLVGYMANNVLPVRLGELVRSYYLASRESVRGSTALATIIVERVFDGLTLLLLLAVAALFLPVAGLAERVGDAVRLPVALVAVIVIVPFAAALAFIVAAALSPSAFHRAASLLTDRLPKSVSERAGRLVERFVGGFEGLHRPKRLLGVVALSLPVWLAEGTMYYIVALGFGLDDHFETFGLMVAAMVVVTTVSNLATSLPSSQGSVGPFEFFAVVALHDFLGVGSGLASAYAVVLHMTLLLPVVAIGLLHLSTKSVTLAQLTRSPARTATEDQP